MGWQDLIKAIPSQAEIEGWLVVPDEGQHIITQFKNAIETGDKKNFRTSKKRLEDIASGEYQGMTEQQIERASKILEAIEAEMDGLDAQGKTSQEVKITDEKLSVALEEYNNGNKEKLISWLGKNNRDRHTKNRISILQNNRTAINQIPEDDEELYYVNFTDDARYSLDDEDITAEQLEQIKTMLEDFGDVVAFDGKKIAPKKMSWVKFQEFKNILDRISKSAIGRYALDSNKSKVPSMLLLLRGEETRSPKELDEIKRFDKNYVSKVNSLEEVLLYFELLTKKGWRKPIFMPDSKLKQKGDSKAMQQLIGARNFTAQSLHPELKVILQSPQYSWKSFMEVAVQEKVQLSSKLRNIIESDEQPQEVLDAAKITESDLAGLRAFANKSKRGKTNESEGRLDYPRFIRSLRTDPKQNDTFRKLQTVLARPKVGLFSEDEKTFLDSLKGVPQDDLPNKISEFYKVDEEAIINAQVISAIRREVNKESPILVQTQEGLVLNPDIQTSRKNKINNTLRAFRQNRDSTTVEVSEDEDSLSLEKIKDALSPALNPLKGGDNKRANILDFIITIDYYYHRSLTQQVDDYYDNREEEEWERYLQALLDAIKQNYSSIINSLLEATKRKIDLIITNKEDYVKAMRFKSKGKTGKQEKIYSLLNKLKEAGLVEEVRE